MESPRNTKLDKVGNIVAVKYKVLLCSFRADMQLDIYTCSMYTGKCSIMTSTPSEQYPCMSIT